MWRRSCARACDVQNKALRVAASVLRSVPRKLLGEKKREEEGGWETSEEDQILRSVFMYTQQQEQEEEEKEEKIPHKHTNKHKT